MVAKNNFRTDAELLLAHWDRERMPVAVAKGFLKMKLSAEDRQRVQLLLERNSQDSITPEEKAELERYDRITLMVGLLQAKAKRQHKDRSPVVTRAH